MNLNTLWGFYDLIYERNLDFSWWFLMLLLLVQHSLLLLYGEEHCLSLYCGSLFLVESWCWSTQSVIAAKDGVRINFKTNLADNQYISTKSLIIFSLSGGRNAMCCRFTTYCQSVLVLIYFLFLALVIYGFVYEYYLYLLGNNVFMGVVLGVGFLPTTMFLVYYWYSTSCACCRRDKSIVMEE